MRSTCEVPQLQSDGDLPLKGGIPLAIALRADRTFSRGASRLIGPVSAVSFAVLEGRRLHARVIPGARGLAVASAPVFSICVFA